MMQMAFLLAQNNMINCARNNHLFYVKLKIMQKLLNAIQNHKN